MEEKQHAEQLAAVGRLLAPTPKVEDYPRAATGLVGFELMIYALVHEDPNAKRQLTELGRSLGAHCRGDKTGRQSFWHLFPGKLAVNEMQSDGEAFFGQTTILVQICQVPARIQ